MTDIWFISDTHFFHAGILQFLDRDLKKFRGQFWQSPYDMNDAIRENWNSDIKPHDKVYHLGDVACGVKYQDEFAGFMKTLNGHKRLILGNHDQLKSPAYQCFEQISLWTGGKFKGSNFVCSHIPLRPDQMRDGEFNVHGHIHQNTIEDPRYINVCVEHTDYKPVHIDAIRAIIKDRSIQH